MHIFTCVSLKCKLLLNVGHRVQPAVAGFAAGSESHPRWTSLNEWNSNSWDSNWESFRTIEMIHQMFVQQSLFPIVDIVADGFDYVHGEKKLSGFFLLPFFEMMMQIWRTFLWRCKWWKAHKAPTVSCPFQVFGPFQWRWRVRKRRPCDVDPRVHQQTKMLRMMNWCLDLHKALMIHIRTMA